jgi:hypothetical protein
MRRGVTDNLTKRVILLVSVKVNKKKLNSSALFKRFIG